MITRLSTRLEKTKRSSEITGLSESYTWQFSLSGSGRYESWWPCKFSTEEYQGSFIWRSNLFYQGIFLVLYTWARDKPLSQAQVISAFGGSKHHSITASIASTLESGRRAGIYKKHGSKKQTEFSIAAGFKETKRFMQIRFVPSDRAIEVVRQRAKALKQSKGM